MGSPVVFSSDSANRIRQAVTAINLSSRPWGGLGSDGENEIPTPMPLDITLNWVTDDNASYAHPMVSLMGLWVSTGRTPIDVDRNNSAISALVTAWDNGEDYYDLGAITSTTYSRGLCFYILARLIANPSSVQAQTKPFINRLYWGITVGTTVQDAKQLVPAESVSPYAPAAGQVSGIVMLVPLGGVNTSNGRQYTWQGFHGSVGVPEFTDVDLVTDMRYDLTTHQLQKKTANYLLFSGGLSTDFTMIENGEAELYP